MFSRLGGWIKGKDIHTPEQMMRGCAEHYKSTFFTESICHFELLSKNYDFKSFLFPPNDNYKYFERIIGFGTKQGSKEHREYKGLRAGSYKFFVPKVDCYEKTENIVCYQWKEWVTDESWLPYVDTVRFYATAAYVFFHGESQGGGVVCFSCLFSCLRFP